MASTQGLGGRASRWARTPRGESLRPSQHVLDGEDIRPRADAIGEEIGLARYRTSSQSFVALGDENGLVLIMRKGVSMRGEADVYPTRVEIDSATPVGLEIEGFPYRIAGA